MKIRRVSAVAVALLTLLALFPAAVGASAEPGQRANHQRARKAVRQAVKAQAEIDRPGELDSVSGISFWEDPPYPVGCTRKHAGAAANFVGGQTPGVYFLCKMDVGGWTVYEGPLYGE
jgi:hypothetical protein